MTTVRELMDRLRTYDPDMPVMVQAWGDKPGVQPMDTTETWGVRKLEDGRHILLFPGDGDPEFSAILIN